MNPELPKKPDNENPHPERRGRPRKNTIRICVKLRPETLQFLRYKARRKVTLGDVIDRAVRHLEIDLMLV